MDLIRYDFGYEWPWTFGHLVGAGVFALAAVAAWRISRLRMALVFAALGVWAVAGAVIVNVVLGFMLPIALPTANFLTSGRGRVLDAGAGSGRSSLMVLLARPEATVTALDIFGTEYGIGGNSPARLRANAGAAGADARLEVQVGDMRAMPFPPASFDAAVTAFAIDHLPRADVPRALGEFGRVVKPGGDLLLLVINQDAWIRVALPFLMHHGYFGGRTNADRWRGQISDAGFEVVEQGTPPGTLYFLARNRRGVP